MHGNAYNDLDFQKQRQNYFIRKMTKIAIRATLVFVGSRACADNHYVIAKKIAKKCPYLSVCIKVRLHATICRADFAHD